MSDTENSKPHQATHRVVVTMPAEGGNIHREIWAATDKARLDVTESGILAPAEEDARRYLGWGCQFIAVGIDISLLRQAALTNLATYRAPAQAAPPSRTY